MSMERKLKKMAKDSVCGREVDEKKASATSQPVAINAGL
jgi:hypothetical protein